MGADFSLDLRSAFHGNLPAPGLRRPLIAPELPPHYTIDAITAAFSSRDFAAR